MKISDTPYYKRKQLPYKLKNINIYFSNGEKKSYFVCNNLLTGFFAAFKKELRIILFLLFGLIGFQNNFAQVSTGMPANDLIGQYTTTSGFVNNWTQGTVHNNNGSTYGLGFNAPRDVIVDTTTHRMYVTDYLNNRILIYNLDNNNILVDKSPDFVLGQTNFTSNSKGLSATKMDAAGRMALDVANQRLFVSDAGAPTITNNRILVFDVTNITNGEAAVNVLGQTSFTKNDVGTSASLMNGPGELEYIPATNRLIVNDQNNHRVLVFDVTDITNGENAINVIGQGNFSGDTPGTSSTKMDVCNGLDYDPVNQLLFVADVNNNRVLVFDIAIITNGEAAINVLGQTNFSNKAAAATQSGLDTPNGVEYSESLQWLFVNDVMNNRVVIYDVSTINNGENAIYVLGQADFTSKVAATTQSGFSENRAVSWEPSTSMLFVGDVVNNRMMVFDIDYVITGNITNVSCYGAPEGAIDISVSGGVAPYTYLWSDGATTADRTNLKAGTYAVTVTYGGSITKTRTFSITQPAPPVVDGQIADDLVGQYTTTTGFTNNYSQSTINNNNGSTFDLGFNTPYDVVIDDVNHRMFVSDRVNHRVLVYNLDNDNILVDKTPDFVLGQANFTANAAANTQAGMNQPTALAYNPATNLLFVAQAGNHRVTVYDVAVITNGENAFRVLGQSNFTNSAAANSATGMSSPSGLAYDAVNQRLFVANSGNHRVTVYDVAAITNGEAAVNVLGQTNFTNSAAATSAIGMRTPAGLAYDAGNQKLYVADGANHRVTVYDVANITNGEAAINVLGQTLFTTATAAITQNGLNIPRGLALDVTSQTLFVSDQSNHRILVYDVNSISDGENAVKVLGQPNFTTGTAGTTQSKLNVPEGMCYDMSNAKLYVSDRSNNRVIIFSFDVAVSGTITNTTCGMDGAVNITASGGTAPYTYNWGNGITSEDRLNIPPGTYTVTVTDACGSSVVQNFTITGPTPLSSSVSKTDVTCFGMSTGSVTISGIGGTMPYQYRINSGNYQTSGMFTNLAAGSYTLTVRDANLCTTIQNVTISQPTSGIILTPAINQPTCFGLGSITLNVSGGSAPYTFDWADISGSSNPQNRLGLSPGSYGVVVSDVNGCTTSSAVLNLTSPTDCAPVSVCRSDVNSVFYVNPDPVNTSYNWTVPAGAVIVSGQGSLQISVNWTNVVPGVYQICAVGQNSCGSSTPNCLNVNVTQPEIEATADPVCSGGTLQLYGSGGIQYLWSGPSGFTSSSSNPSILNVNGTNHNGYYKVTVTDINGCRAIDSINVTVLSGPVISSGVTNSQCGLSTGAVNISVSGGTPSFSYLWNTGATSQNLVNIPSGVYRLTVTDSAGCKSIKSDAVLTTSGPAVALTKNNVNCFGGNTGSINSSVSGGTSPYTYLWSNGATTPNINTLPVGNYSVVVTDQAGCQGAAVETITQPAALSSDYTQQNVKCFGASTGSIDLIVSGGTSPYNYTWTKNNVAYGGNTQDLSALGAGTYRVTITDAFSCTSTNLITISQPGSVITASSVITPVACNGQQNGRIVLTVNGGESPYLYSWSGPSGFTAATKDINGVIAGTYNVTITDQNGCLLTLTGLSVTAPAALSLSPVVSQNVSCNNGADGSIDISVSGGNPPYTYLWSNSSVTQDITALHAGTYQVVVTDNKGCTATVSRNISQPSVLTATSVLSHVACYGNNTGAINVTVSGGTSPYSYQWSDGSFTGQDRSSVVAGLYIVTVTDSKSCKVTLQNAVNQNSEIMISGLVTNPLCQGNNTGSIQLNVSGGSGTYTYSWSNGLPAVQNPSGLSAGTYVVTVTDQAGCTKTQNFTVSQPSVISITHTSIDVSCNGQGDGSISVVVTGGTQPYLYAWSNGENAANIQNLSPNIYTVTVTDANNCEQQQTITIYQPTQLIVSGTFTPNCPQQNNGNITINVSGGTSPYTYLWSDIGASSGLRTGLGTGLYAVSVNDANGCNQTLSFELSPLQITTSASDRTCFGNDGLALVSATGGVMPYNFNWNNGMTTEEISGLSAGTYTVTVTSGSCTATGSVIVGAPSGCLPPLAVDDYFTIEVNTTLTNTVMPPNPTDPGYDSDPVFALSELQFENLTPINPIAGIISWEEDGSFTYTPANGYIGSFSLDYRICNPLGLCDEATLYIEVIPDCDAQAPVISEY